MLEALKEICRVIEAGISNDAQTHREMSAARAELLRRVYVLAENAVVEEENAKWRL